MSSGRLSAYFHKPHLHYGPSPDKRDAWPETAATVADCLSLSEILKKSSQTADLYTIRFTYWVDTRMFTGCFKSTKCYAPGDALPVRYDPRHPERNSADPEEKLRTGLLVAASVALVALYFVLALHR